MPNSTAILLHYFFAFFGKIGIWELSEKQKKVMSAYVFLSDNLEELKSEIIGPSKRKMYGLLQRY